MLVDDEVEIREGIKHAVNWEEIGLDLVATAENGQEALELATSLNPDIVMTDIKMPFMDGLELGKLLRASMPEIKLVIFSGFDEFDYAQKAIQIKALEYILKPIDAQELTSLLQKILVQLDNEFIEKYTIEQLQTRYENSLPILREQFYIRLLNTNVSSSWVKEQIEIHDIEISGNCWSVSLLQLNSEVLPEQHSPMFTGGKELLPHMIKHLVEENLIYYCDFKCIFYNDYIAVIAMLEKPGGIISFINGMNQICKLAQRHLSLALSAGIGAPCNDLCKLHFSAQGARNALEYRVLTENGSVIYIDDVEPVSLPETLHSSVDFQELITAIKMGDSVKIKREVEQVIHYMREINLQLFQYQQSIIEVMGELLKIIRTYQLNCSEILGTNLNIEMPKFGSQNSFRKWLLDVSLKIGFLIRQERNNSAKVIVESAKRFIEDNYSSTELSLELLCAHIHLSPTYFSTLFKRETGFTFINYLTKVRLEAAIKLLNTTDLLANQIAQEVGYSEPTYFSYVFKKKFGMSPTKYRSLGEDYNKAYKKIDV